MSHVAAIDIAIQDLECLKKAAEACGLKFNEGQKTYKWYGQWVNDYDKEDAAYKQGIKPEDYGKCEHAISIPGNSSAYEVGVVPNPDKKVGGWKLIWDFYAGGHGLQKMLGGSKDCNKLMDNYAKQATIKFASANGYSYEEEEVDGQIQLTLTDYSDDSVGDFGY